MTNQTDNERLTERGLRALDSLLGMPFFPTEAEVRTTLIEPLTKGDIERLESLAQIRSTVVALLICEDKPTGKMPIDGLAPGFLDGPYEPLDVTGSPAGKTRLSEFMDMVSNFFLYLYLWLKYKRQK